MHWYEQIGYGKNPLEVDPFKTDSEFVKYHDELSEVLYHLNAGNIVLLLGPKSSGKSALLKEIFRKMPSVYVNAKQTSLNENLEETLMQKRSLDRKIAGQNPKDLLLLVDNAEYLSEENCERIKYFYDEGYVKSVVFTAREYGKLLFSQSLKERIGRRITTLRHLSAKDAIVITKKRLFPNRLLSDATILKIFRFSGNDLKLHLINVASLLKQLVEHDRETITDAEMERLFADNFYREEETCRDCQKCGKKLILSDDGWSCPECKR